MPRHPVIVEPARESILPWIGPVTKYPLAQNLGANNLHMQVC